MSPQSRTGKLLGKCGPPIPHCTSQYKQATATQTFDHSTGEGGAAEDPHRRRGHRRHIRGGAAQQCGGSGPLAGRGQRGGVRVLPCCRTARTWTDAAAAAVPVHTLRNVLCAKAASCIAGRLTLHSSAADRVPLAYQMGLGGGNHLWHDVQTAQELQQLFRLLEAYGCADWLVFDASIMRGLAYYTGVRPTR